MGSVARASNVPYLGDLRQELLDEGPVLGFTVCSGTLTCKFVLTVVTTN